MAHQKDNAEQMRLIRLDHAHFWLCFWGHGLGMVFSHPVTGRECNGDWL